jgi:hypothetical protein
MVTVPDQGETVVPVILRVSSGDLPRGERGERELERRLRVVVRQPSLGSERGVAHG